MFNADASILVVLLISSSNYQAQTELWTELNKYLNVLVSQTPFRFMGVKADISML